MDGELLAADLPPGLDALFDALGHVLDDSGGRVN
jgi:hypothetical protein